jgi:hypothetical protein
MESKIPPTTANIIASIGYPFIRMLGRNFSTTNESTGPNTPIKIEAKGSMMTVADELRKTPVYISQNIPKRSCL